MKVFSFFHLYTSLDIVALMLSAKAVVLLKLLFCRQTELAHIREYFLITRAGHTCTNLAYAVPKGNLVMGPSSKYVTSLAFSTESCL